MTEAAVAATGETMTLFNSASKRTPLHQLAVPLERPALQRE